MYLGYRTIQLWCCVSFFGIFFVVAGKWFWQEIGSFFVVAGKFYYDRKKKIQSSVWRVRDHYCDRKKKDTVVCLVGARTLLRPEKKDTVVCLAGCAVVSVFGSGGKLAVFLLWREHFITTGKKKIQSSVWRVRDHYYDRKKKIQSSVWRVRDHYYYRKKRYSHLSGGLCCCVSFWFWREIGIFFVVAGKFH